MEYEGIKKLLCELCEKYSANSTHIVLLSNVIDILEKKQYTQEKQIDDSFEKVTTEDFIETLYNAGIISTENTVDLLMWVRTPMIQQVEIPQMQPGVWTPINPSYPIYPSYPTYPYPGYPGSIPQITYQAATNK